MAKYEAGQLWVKGRDWFCVVETGRGCEWLTIVTNATDVVSDGYSPAEIDERYPGYTLSNPRGLREAAEAVFNTVEIIERYEDIKGAPAPGRRLACTSGWLQADEAVAIVRPADLEALRAALEGSDDGR